VPVLRVHSVSRGRASTTRSRPRPGNAKSCSPLRSPSCSRERWLASHHKQPEQLIFCTRDGHGLDYRHVGEAFRKTIHRSGVTATGRLSLHSFRHAFASLLIANGLNVVYVSRQLGHANPTITLGTYAHLFQRADHAHAAREALDASYEAMANGGGLVG
jgi:site-specific recombinase XerD